MGLEFTRERLEHDLERVRRWYGCYVTGYVIMPEHVHLLLSEPRRSLLCDAIKSLKQGVARRAIAAVESSDIETKGPTQANRRLEWATPFIELDDAAGGEGKAESNQFRLERAGRRLIGNKKGRQETNQVASPAALPERLAAPHRRGVHEQRGHG